MGINTPQELLELLQQSRLLSTEQLDDVHDSMLLTHDVSKLLDMLVDREILTEWQKMQLLAGRTGFFIGNYVLLGLLGRGGMGSVFLGRHTTMNRRCAVKVVSKKVGKEPDALDQFLTEARAIASLDHPNIVQAYDVDKENDHFYIVMEYVEGQSLEEIIKIEGVLDCESAVDCIRQAAEGLAHAHGRNMVHCDIKPSNLLVNEQGVVKILDMGMARLVGDTGINGSTSDSHSKDRILGTVDYMSPEQAVSGPSFDFRADIYSLGCTLFALLAGHPPFNEGNLTQRILKHQTQAPPNLRRLRSDVPADLAAICAKMMAKNPDDRYQSAQEVANVLSKWKVTEESITSERIQNESIPMPGAEGFDENAIGGVEAVAGPTIETRRPKKKNFWEDERLLLPALVVIIVIVFGLLLFIVITSSQDSSISNEPETPTETVSPSRTGTLDPEGGSPDGVKPPETVPGSPDDTTPPNGTSTDPVKPNPDGPVIKPLVQDETTQPVKTPVKIKQTPSPIPSVNPLIEFPKAVDFPQRLDMKSPDSVKPLLLGNFLFRNSSKDARLVQLQLIGGDVVLAQNHAFTIVKSPLKGLPKWMVLLAWNNTQINVAQIWIEEDNNLRFQWLNTDSEVPAELLSACILRISAGKYVRHVKLSTPRQVEPWRIIPARDTISYDVKPLILPDTKALYLELFDYSGPYTEVTYKPSAVLGANKQTTVTLTGEGLPTLTIRFEFYVKGRATRLDASCWYEPRKGRPVRISLKNPSPLFKIGYDLEKKRKTLENLMNRNSGNKSYRTRHDQIVEEQKELSALGDILKTFADPAQIPVESKGLGVFQFHEYIKAGNYKIELLKTNGRGKIFGI